MRLTIPQWHGLLHIRDGRWGDVRYDVRRRLAEKGLIELAATGSMWSPKSFRLTEAGVKVVSHTSYTGARAALEGAET